MKKQVTAFIQSCGGTAHYSGKLKIMFIGCPKTEGAVNSPYGIFRTAEGIELVLLKRFGLKLPFRTESKIIPSFSR